MSAFRPDNYAEAVATHKPLARRKPLKAAGQGDSPSRNRKVSPRRLSATKRPARRQVKKVKTSTRKKTAWQQFSIWIRTRGADENGFNKCVTCGVTKFWPDLQAGHFIAGRLNGNLFDERGCHPQCSLCNVVKHGNGPMYYKFMLATYGQAVIDELLAQNDVTKKWTPGELQSLFEKYRALNAANPIVKEAKAA